MRILLVSDHYPPFVGGAQRQTLLLAQELQRRGHVASVATVWQDDLPRRHADDGVEVARIHQLRTFLPILRGRRRRRHQPPFPDPVSVFELRRLVRGFRPDVVHAAGWFSYSCAAALLGTGVPLLYSARDYGFSCPNATLVRRERVCSGPALSKCLPCAGRHYGIPRGWLATLGVRGFEFLLRGRVTGVHSVSRYVESIVERDLLGGEHALPATAEVIPSFRVDDTQDGDARLLDCLPNEPFILFVGALRRVKGIDTLLAAYSALRQPPPLVLLGTPERDTPTQLPAGVLTIDALPSWAVLRAWDRSLFGVMPSLWPEPFGSVVHEAMSRGKAVIGSIPGGHSDMIVDGETGLLVPSGDVDALRVAMERLLSDAALRERLGRGAAERAKEFTSDAVVPRFESLYERLSSRQSHTGARRAQSASPSGAGLRP